ncbi:MAG: DUF4358 domain-containing protein [Ruminococcus sp.]|nr:DUF4358 domain-containing protein [Ruminococcus sp.]
MSERIKEILCVLMLVVFIFLLTGNAKVSSKTADEISASVSKTMDTKGLEKCKTAKFKKEFGFDMNAFDSVVYLASDSVMDVRELLIVHLKESSPEEELMQAIESRIKDKAALFKGYAPEESALLESYILKKEAGVILFAVCKNPDSVYTAFKKAL